MTLDFHRVKFLALQPLEEFLLSDFFSSLPPPPWLIQDIRTISYAGVFSLSKQSTFIKYLHASNFVCLALFIFFDLAVHNVWNKWIRAFLGIGYILSHLSSFCWGNQSCAKAIFYWFCLFFLRSVDTTVTVDCFYSLECFLFSSPELACWQTQCFTISWIGFTDHRWPLLHFSWYTWVFTQIFTVLNFCELLKEHFLINWLT